MKKPSSKKAAAFQYSGQQLLQIAMPMGGIGAGSISLNGQGGLQDFAIRNQPSLTSLPSGHSATDSAFALLHLPSREITRLVEGPMPPEKIYDQGLQAQGYWKGGHEGLPRFQGATFEGKYPFGKAMMEDPSLPVRAEVVGFNPFIPRDARDSGFPCAILEYTLFNTSRSPLPYEFSFHLSHLAPGTNPGQKNSRSSVIPGRGIFFYNVEDPHAPEFGSACLMTLKGRPQIRGMWLRGGWFDAISSVWRHATDGVFHPNSGSDGIDVEGRNGGSLLFRGTLPSKGSVRIPLVISWYFPNCTTSFGTKDSSEEPSCCGKEERCESPLWRPYYAGVWKDAAEVAGEVCKRYSSLRDRTKKFQKALFSSTVPREILDAVSANLGILKSPTVLRLENGSIWGWEGCFPSAGCCPGSCTHVWNYAQAMPHLFPDLERTLREAEFLRVMNDSGQISFRFPLPEDWKPTLEFGAAADGQLGGILKFFRDAKISGNLAWIRKFYPLVKRSLEWCIRTWDPDRLGAIIEPHHNTYDINFWGPDGMCTSLYIGALCAMEQLAGIVGEEQDAETYRELARKGARFMDEQLFNGSYYQQDVRYEGLRDTSFLEAIQNTDARSGELAGLLRKEGPKYQYGSGCLSDGVIGAWMATLYGLDLPLDKKHVKSNLKAIHANNFFADLREHACCQRPGYALGQEGGLLMCTWPRGGKPTLPFVYSDEVWTGVEYQVASHLIMEGFVREGLQIVKTARSRYDGRTRNPWNEYECGSFYARAMASYALLIAYSGFEYSALSGDLRLAPVTRKLPFSSFFSTEKAHGTLELSKTHLVVNLIEGILPIRNLALGKSRVVPVEKTAKANRPLRIRID